MHRSTSPAAGRRRVAPAVVVATGLTAAGVVFAGPASAHVSVNPGEASQEGVEKLAFRVPNESDSAGTVKLEVTLPAETPLAFVSVKPHPNWEVKVTKIKLDEPVEAEGFTLTEAVGSITWRAKPGTRIGPGEFDEFEVSAGPLPETDQLAFPVVQTYDDGEVVSWDEPTPAGGEEPEHPVPTLRLRADGDGHGAAEGGAPQDAVPASSSAASTAGSDDAARTLGAAGLGVGLLGVATGALAVLRSRRRESP